MVDERPLLGHDEGVDGFMERLQHAGLVQAADDRDYRTSAHTLSAEQLSSFFMSELTDPCCCSKGPAGLTQQRALKYLEVFGKNERPQLQQSSQWLNIVKAMLTLPGWGPLSWFLIVMLLVWDSVSTVNVDHATLPTLAFFVVYLALLVWFLDYNMSAWSQQHTLANDRVYTVRRDEVGQRQELQLEATELVPGDIVFLTAGQRIPADIRILSCTEGTAVDNSSLTGEAIPEPRVPQVELPGVICFESRNLLFCETTLLEGAVTGMVISTGGATFMGKIALMIRSSRVRSTLELQIDQFVAVSKKVVTYCVFVVLVASVLFSDTTFANVVSNCLALNFILVPADLVPVTVFSLTVALSRFFTQGLMIRKIDVLETLNCISILCLDQSCVMSPAEDVPKPDVSTAVARANGMGMKVVLMTENDVETALKVAAKLAILSGPQFRFPFVELKTDALDMIRVYTAAGSLVFKVTWDKQETVSDVLSVIAFKTQICELLGGRPSMMNLISQTDGALLSDQDLLSDLLPQGPSDRPLGVQLALKSVQTVWDEDIDDFDFTVVTGRRLRVGEQTSVCASMCPDDKQTLIQSYQDDLGKVVAMVSGRLEDCAGLKQAEVGIVDMGCTYASKSAADVVLLNDSVASIMDGVEQSRLLSSNLQKCVRYVLSSKLPLLLPALVEAFGLPQALTLTQAIVIICSTDIWTAFAFVAQPAEPKLQQRPPQLAKGMVSNLKYGGCYIGLLQALCCWIMFYWASLGEGNNFGKTSAGAKDTAMTVYCWTLVLGRIAAAISLCASSGSVFTTRSHPRMPLIATLAIKLLVGLAAIYWAPMRGYFKMVSLPADMLLVPLFTVAAVFLIEEIRKLVVNAITHS